MNNPTIVACPKDAWTKVATNVQIGNIWLGITDPGQYSQTYRLTGGIAPTLAAEGAPIPRPGIGINSSVGIDVYVWASNKDGSVRVDV